MPLCTSPDLFFARSGCLFSHFADNTIHKSFTASMDGIISIVNEIPDNSVYRRYYWLTATWRRRIVCSISAQFGIHQIRQKSILSIRSIKLFTPCFPELHKQILAYSVSKTAQLKLLSQIVQSQISCGKAASVLEHHCFVW